MRNEYRSIQHLRALAAFMIVIFHLGFPLARMGWPNASPHWLQAGVDIFFVISGFIMWVTTCHTPTTPTQFFRKRLLRIIPLYWIGTATLVIAMLLLPGVFQNAPFDFAHIAASFLFLPTRHPLNGYFEPLLVQGWTLNYEMFFYLIFGLTLTSPLSVRLAATCGSLALVVLIGMLVTSPPDFVAFYSNSLVLEFGFGLVLGWSFTRANRKPQGRIIPCLALLGGCIATVGLPQYFPSLPGVASAGLPAAGIVWGAVALEESGAVGFRSHIINRLGDASYALYLFHALVLSAVSLAWRRMGLDGGAAGAFAFCALGVFAACVVAIIVHDWIEKPVAHLLRRSEPRRDPVLA